MDREIKRIIKMLIFFTSLFVIIIVYLTVFQLFKADDIKNHKYNHRNNKINLEI